jgi:hypothetical protein
MKFLLLLPILLLPIIPPQDPDTEGDAPVSVVSFKWFKDRRFPAYVTVSPARGTHDVDSGRRSVDRSKRGGDPGIRDDPHSIEARSAELERIVENQSDENPAPIDGFTYQTKIQNQSPKAVAIVFLEFQFKEKTNPANFSRRQFICRAKMKPDKLQEISIFTIKGPGSVVSVGSLKKKSHDEFEQKVIINRVEYDDGSVWQRKGWNFDEVKLNVKPVAGSSRFQPCRGL